VVLDPSEILLIFIPDFSGFFRIFQDFSGFFRIFQDYSGLFGIFLEAVCDGS